ncbi:MAG TPA: NosD domain-containing protein [Solirubrobacter sp.]
MPAHVKPLIAAAAAIICIALGAPPAQAAGPTCGSVVMRSTTLRADLTNCPDDGLVIGADNLILDLGGHTIDGIGTTEESAGVRLAGHHGVTIQGGTVREFDYGVKLDGADGNTVLGVTATRNFERGVQLQEGSDGNRVAFVVATGNGLAGIVVFLSDRNVIAHATGSHNTFNGLTVAGSSGTRVSDSTFAGNTTGIGLVNGSSASVVAGNVVSGNAEAALAIESDDNVITRNRVEHNGWGISFGGDRNQIVANVVTDSLGCSDGDCGTGIETFGGAGNLIASNLVTDTVDQGIRLREFEADGGPPTIGNVIRANIVRGAGSGGIVLQDKTDEVTGHGTLKDNLVANNVVTGSGDDGINVTRPANTVSGNVTLRNRSLGIEAVPGVIDGGRNLAFGNGDPRQCVIVACH